MNEEKLVAQLAALDAELEVLNRKRSRVNDKLHHARKVMREERKRAEDERKMRAREEREAVSQARETDEWIEYIGRPSKSRAPLPPIAPEIKLRMDNNMQQWREHLVPAEAPIRLAPPAPPVYEDDQTINNEQLAELCRYDDVERLMRINIAERVERDRLRNRTDRNNVAHQLLVAAARSPHCSYRCFSYLMTLLYDREDDFLQVSPAHYIEPWAAAFENLVIPQESWFPTGDLNRFFVLRGRGLGRQYVTKLSARFVVPEEYRVLQCVYAEDLQAPDATQQFLNQVTKLSVLIKSAGESLIVERVLETGGVPALARTVVRRLIGRIGQPVIEVIDLLGDD